MRLSDERIIICELAGSVDEEIIKNALNEIKPLAEELHSKGEKVFVLVDGLRAMDRAIAVRSSVRMLSEMHMDKLAIVSKGLRLALVGQYLGRASGVKGEIRQFRGRFRAKRWLLKKKNGLPGSERSVIGGASVLIGSFCGRTVGVGS